MRPGQRTVGNSWRKYNARARRIAVWLGGWNNRKLRMGASSATCSGRSPMQIVAGLTILFTDSPKSDQWRSQCHCSLEAGTQPRERRGAWEQEFLVTGHWSEGSVVQKVTGPNGH